MQLATGTARSKPASHRIRTGRPPGERRAIAGRLQSDNTAHHARLDHLIHQLTHHDRSRQELQSGARVLNRQDNTTNTTQFAGENSA